MDIDMIISETIKVYTSRPQTIERSNGRWTSRFFVNDHEYKAEATKSRKNETWSFSFYCVDLDVHDRTGLGDHFEVWSAVASAMLKFIEQESPESIFFETGIFDYRRSSVYRRILKRFEPDIKALGYGLKLGSGIFTIRKESNGL